MLAMAKHACEQDKTVGGWVCSLPARLQAGQGGGPGCIHPASMPASRARRWLGGWVCVGVGVGPGCMHPANVCALIHCRLPAPPPLLPVHPCTLPQYCLDLSAPFYGT